MGLQGALSIGRKKPIDEPSREKTMEQVVHNQIMSYFNQYKILSEAQFRFRNGHSTTTCILSFLNDVYINIDNGLYPGVVFLDPKKAFDMVDHDILVEKLRMYGISSNSCKWFKDYLTEHTQCTKVNGIFSGV